MITYYIDSKTGPKEIEKQAFEESLEMHSKPQYRAYQKYCAMQSLTDIDIGIQISNADNVKDINIELISYNNKKDSNKQSIEINIPSFIDDIPDLLKITTDETSRYKQRIIKIVQFNPIGITIRNKINRIEFDDYEIKDIIDLRQASINKFEIIRDNKNNQGIHNRTIIIPYNNREMFKSEPCLLWNSIALLYDIHDEQQWNEIQLDIAEINKIYIKFQKSTTKIVIPGELNIQDISDEDYINKPGNGIFNFTGLVTMQADKDRTSDRTAFITSFDINRLDLSSLFKSEMLKTVPQMGIPNLTINSFLFLGDAADKKLTTIDWMTNNKILTSKSGLLAGVQNVREMTLNFGHNTQKIFVPDMHPIDNCRDMVNLEIHGDISIIDFLKTLTNQKLENLTDIDITGADIIDESSYDRDKLLEILESLTETLPSLEQLIVLGDKLGDSLLYDLETIETCKNKDERFVSLNVDYVEPEHFSYRFL